MEEFAAYSFSIGTSTLIMDLVVFSSALLSVYHVTLCHIWTKGVGWRVTQIVGLKNTWKCCDCPFIVSLSLMPVSVVTYVMFHVLPSCKEGVTLTEEVSGSEAYKHTIQNCCSAPLYDNTVGDVGHLWCAACTHALQFTLPTVFVASVMMVFIYQEHIYILQVVQKCL